MSNNQALEQFKEAIYDSLGYAPVDVIGDGAIHHFKNEQGKINGAYRFYSDNRPSGWYQCHKQGIFQKWTLSGGYVPISSMQQMLNQAKYRQEAKDRQKAELAKQAAVAVVATKILNQAPFAPANHPIW